MAKEFITGVARIWFKKTGYVGKNTGQDAT